MFVIYNALIIDSVDGQFSSKFCKNQPHFKTTKGGL